MKGQEIAKLKARPDAADKKLKKLQTKLNSKKRKLVMQQKIITGSAVLEAVKAGDFDRELLKGILD